jgi:putative addiction module component (TIGR02574 family)
MVMVVYLDSLAITDNLNANLDRTRRIHRIWGLFMTLPINVSEIKSMSIPERILLVEEIWDSIAAQQEAVELTAAQRDELDRRLESCEGSPNEGTSWEEVKSRLRRQK